MPPRKRKEAAPPTKRSKVLDLDVATGKVSESEDDAELDGDEPGDDEGDDLEEGDADELSAAFEETEDVDASEIDEEVRRRITPRSGDRTELIKRDPLTAYMQEARRYPLLDRDEEHRLAVRLVEHGDTGAARRLIEANLRLVVKIAYEYRRAHKNLLDLIQEGNIGLIQAVSKYDPHRGVKLSSYAAWWIRAYILKFVLNNWRLVKIGTTQAQRKLFFNLRKERERLEQLGFSPTPQLLAENLDVSEKDVVEMEKRLSAPDASLDAPLGGDDDGSVRTRMDFLAGDGERPDTAVENQEFQSLLREKLAIFADGLEGREETIFRERWLTDEPLTLQEIGDKYGVSRERARQIEKRMLGRLRTYLEAELGSAVDIDAMGRD